jgi:hypothetical protein
MTRTGLYGDVLMAAAAVVAVCTENLIRVDDVVGSLKLAK